MSIPRRIQRKRSRGWRMPDGAVYVGRPTTWGNPFRVTRSSDYHGLPGSWFVLDETGTAYHPEQNTERSARQRAVDLFAHTVSEREDARVNVRRIQDELAGHDLVCWCPSSEPCHADVLLAIANRAASSSDQQDRQAERPAAPRGRSGAFRRSMTPGPPPER